MPMRACLLIVFLTAVLAAGGCQHADAPPRASALVVPVETRSRLASWPWPSAAAEKMADGMTRTVQRDADGTGVLLLQFDTLTEKGLHFELYDADEDDAAPDDDRVEPSDRLFVPVVYDHLKDRGRILAVVNGPFFKNSPLPIQHTAAVVRKGMVYANVGCYRWAFGVKETRQGPSFALVHLATRKQLRAFDWGSGNVQALVVDGRPTRIPLPTTSIPEPKSAPSQPGDCGPFPYIDYIKTARVSLGWRRGAFALLVVTQADGENEDTSNTLRLNGEHQRSGWDLVDLQQFWMAWGAEGACNFDGGLSTQAAYATPTGMQVQWSTGPAGIQPGGRSTGALLFPYVVWRPSR